MISIVLPVPPQRGNDRSHWTKVMKEKKAYYKECGWILKKFRGTRIEYHFEGQMLTDKEKGLPPTFIYQYELKMPFEFVEWEASMDVQRMHDFDNFISRFKWGFDALVQNGIIKDDSWAHCRPRSFPTQILKPKKLDKRELRITLYPRGKFEEILSRTLV